MNKTLLALFLIFSIANVSAAYKLTVKNNSKQTITDAPVVVELNKLKHYDGEKLTLFIDNKEVDSQLDDLNRDGKFDELAFEYNFKAGEKIKIKLLKKEPTIYTSGVYTSLIKKDDKGNLNRVDSASSDKNDMYNKLHHHGVAFESDKIAYRIYFDNKSTIDIYGKKKYGFELKENDWYPTEQQLKEGFGDDILLVSGWVGNGAVKGFQNGKALHMDKFAKRTHRIIAKGPVRAVVQSELKAWEYKGKKLDLTVRYILYAGHRDVKAEIYSSQNIDTIATGVQQIGGGQLYQTNDLVGSWGSWYPQPDSVKYAKETVGLGLYLSKNGKQFQDGANNLITFPVKNKISFYFTTIAAKEEGQKIQDAKAFFDYIEGWKSTVDQISVHY